MKIGLLSSGTISEYRLQTLKPVFEDNNMSIELVIVDDRPKKSIKQKIKKNFKRGRGGYMLIMAIKSILFPKKDSSSLNIKDFCSDKNIDIIRTVKPYSDTTINSIKKYDLDVLILIGGYGIIKPKLLNITKFGVLSYHHGNMRKYRGMPPAFWELYNNEKEVGITVQVLAEGLDCGIPITEKTININKKDSYSSIKKDLKEISVDMMYTSLKKLLDSNFVPEKITTFGKVYTLPNLRQWLIFNIKLFFRRIL
ncbi:MAG: formyltransferase family protein [Bacteroidales bacterium]|jgi:folate-dependent phosphoribosylglycinamide formyltransferase PurN|nr:formyltransferase family protein [Bacteroidales bacterium]